ncbi:MAG: hypothetical protein WC612_02000 [Bdellovibrionales bacterium]|jgi:hypothetical protein
MFPTFAQFDAIFPTKEQPQFSSCDIAHDNGRVAIAYKNSDGVAAFFSINGREATAVAAAIKEAQPSLNNGGAIVANFKTASNLSVPVSLSPRMATSFADAVLAAATSCVPA